MRLSNLLLGLLLILSSCSSLEYENNETNKTSMSEIGLIYSPTIETKSKNTFSTKSNSCPELQVKIQESKLTGNGCCSWVVTLDGLSQKPVFYEVRYDGKSIKSGSLSQTSVQLTVENCDSTPKLIEVFIGKTLCYSELLTCESQTCCSSIDVSLNGYNDGDCCVFTWTVDDPLGCWDGTMAFGFNPELGPPDKFMWHADGVTVYICDTEQWVFFNVWSDSTMNDLCYESRTFRRNDCLD